MGGRENWSDLPKDLLLRISKRLDSQFDIIRLRSVCSSWRKFIPFTDQISLCFLHKLPFHRAPRISKKPLHCLKPSDRNKRTYSSWLVKIQPHIFNPISNHRFKILPNTFFKKNLGLLDFGVFALSYDFGVKKTVFFPDFVWGEERNCCCVLAIYGRGNLGFWKHGDERWTLINEKFCYYTDIIIYKEQFHVVDEWGTVSKIDSSLKLIKMSAQLNHGIKKSLVESCGDLYVVDKIIETGMPVDFKVYKLIEKEYDFVEVKSLEDRALFVGDDCSFFVSAQEFPGCRGNCIYFPNDNPRALHGHNMGVFNLEDRTVGGR